MIIGLGTDIINIERVAAILQKFERRFLERTFTPEECAEIAGCGDNEQKRACKAAKLFAAKEAAAKALGTGFAEGVSWQDVTVNHEKSGKPLLKLCGAAADRADKLAQGRPYQILLSLSDDFPFAQAVVIIEIL